MHTTGRRAIRKGAPTERPGSHFTERTQAALAGDRAPSVSIAHFLTHCFDAHSLDRSTGGSSFRHQATVGTCSRRMTKSGRQHAPESPRGLPTGKRLKGCQSLHCEPGSQGNGSANVVQPRASARAHAMEQTYAYRPVAAPLTFAARTGQCRL